MRTASCPRCAAPINYIPEQEGQSAFCPKCGLEVPLRRDALYVLRWMALATLSVAGTFAMWYFGLMGMVLHNVGHSYWWATGFAPLSAGGVFILGLMLGLQMRDVLYAFAVYAIGMVVFIMIVGK